MRYKLIGCALTDNLKQRIVFHGLPTGTSEPTEETTSTDVETENAEIHGNSPAHLEKVKAFNHYKDLYLSKVHPLYTREALLFKVLEDHSLYVKVQLDMDRLEASLSAVKSEVQNIETALKWEKVSLLQNAITESEITLQKTERVVEQGNHDRCLEIFT